MCTQSLSCVQFFATPWTVAHQSSVHEMFSKNTRVGCHFLLQGIFPTKGLNLCLLHLQVDSLPLFHLGSPCASYLIQDKKKKRKEKKRSDMHFILSRMQPRVQGISKGGFASKKGGSVYMLDCCC